MKHTACVLVVYIVCTHMHASVCGVYMSCVYISICCAYNIYKCGMCVMWTVCLCTVNAVCVSGTYDMYGSVFVDLCLTFAHLSVLFMLCSQVTGVPGLFWQYNLKKK